MEPKARTKWECGDYGRPLMRSGNRGRTGRSVRANQYCAFSIDGAGRSSWGCPAAYQVRIHRAGTCSAVPLVFCDEICLSGDRRRDDGEPSRKLFGSWPVQSGGRCSELPGRQARSGRHGPFLLVNRVRPTTPDRWSLRDYRCPYPGDSPTTRRKGLARSGRLDGGLCIAVDCDTVAGRLVARHADCRCRPCVHARHAKTPAARGVMISDPPCRLGCTIAAFCFVALSDRTMA